jgi:hypothetical protein
METSYQKNRTKILEQNKEYYHRRKENPEFYKKVLDRNKKYYHKRAFRPASEMTQEEKDADERQMHEIIKWIRETQAKDKSASEPVLNEWAEYYQAIQQI